MNRRRLLSVGAGFSVPVLLTATVQFFTFPLLISSLGPEQWASLTLGTTIGMAAALVAGWGWPLTGAAELASRPRNDRAEFLQASFLIRVPLSILTLAGMTVVIWLVPSPNTVATWLSATASLISVGLTPSWYFVGTVAPRRYFLLFALPSLVGILTGTFFALLTQDARMHAGTNLAAALLVGSWCTVSVIREESLRDAPRPSGSVLRREFRAQRHSVGVGLLSSSNSALPLVVVAQWLPQHLPAYALTERLYKLALTVSSPVVQAVHGQVPDASTSTTLRRLKQALPLVTTVAFATGVGFALTIPWASHLYTSGHILISAGMSFSFGIALAALLVSSSVGVVGLAITRNSDWFLRSAGLGTLACAVSLTLAVQLDAGAVGVALSIAAAEVVVVATQLHRLRVLLRAGAAKTRQQGG